MDRWHTLRAVGVAAAGWAFAIAAAVYGAPHPAVVIAGNVACTASVWVIARMSVDKIKHDVLASIEPQVTPNNLRKIDP